MFLKCMSSDDHSSSFLTTPWMALMSKLAVEAILMPQLLLSMQCTMSPTNFPMGLNKSSVAWLEYLKLAYASLWSTQN